VLRALRAFLALHHRGTIAAAADDVHLSPAAVSAQLKLLEERLGVELFVRTKRSLKLSSAGHRLIPLAERMMSVHEEMLQLSDPDALHGPISLGGIHTVLLGIFPVVLRKLKAEAPRLRVKITGGNSPELIAQIEAGLLDAAVITRPPHPLSDKLLVHHLYSEPFALILPEGWACASLTETLTTSPYIALDRTNWVGRSIDAFLLRSGIDIRPAVELSSQDAVLTFVKYGHGVSVLPILRGEAQIVDQSLQVVPIPGFERNVSLVERKIHARSHLTAKLLKSIVEVTNEDKNTKT